MAQIRHEIYDETGLVRVEFIEVDEQTPEEIIAEKQAQLLQIYAEIQALQSGSL